MHRKKTNKEFLEEVYNLVGDEYSVLSEYKNTHTKILMKHNKCGNTYEVRPSSFLRGHSCPKCMLKVNAKHRTKTNKEFKEEVYNLVGDEYSVLGNYTNNKTKIKIKHNKCNSLYEVRPRDFLSGNRCPNCFRKSKKTNEEFLKEVYDLVGNEYTFLEKYKTNKTKIKVKHNVCGNIYEVTPNKFRQGSRCPKCFGNTKNTTKQFKQEVYDLVGSEYILKSDYVNRKKKVDLLHTKCNQIYRVTPSDFLFSGSRCSCEQHLKGETKIKEYLDKYQIKYEQHKRFDWLRYSPKSTQHLDFYLPDYNLAIEYDGEFHSQLIRMSKHETKQDIQNRLKNNILRDRNKNKLLKEHNIKLIRIPYYQFDSIDKILDKALK